MFRKQNFKLLTRILVLISLALVLAACGGGGGGTTSSGDSSPPSGDGGDGTTTASPVISGFDFTLQTGDFWEFQWDYYKSSWAQGSSTTTTNLDGRFRVTLGNSVLIGGIEAFEVILSGRSSPVSTTDFAPRWKYVAISENKFLGGLDSSSLSIIFDAHEGIWSGGGFFATFPTSTLISAVSGTISNSYITDSGYVVERSASESQCEYFPGVGTICGDSSFNYTESEVLKAGVGPLGFYYYNTYSDCGGGFCSGATWEHNVGLVASSLRGDIITYDLEIESNNSTATATQIDTSRGLWGDHVDEDNYGTTQIIAINSTEETSNSTSSGPQIISIPTLVNADVLANDPGEWLTISGFPFSGNTYNEWVEDWYYFTLSQSQVLEFTLDFSGDSTADLDLFVLQDTTGYPLKGSSIADNPATGDPTESMVLSLGVGSYWIAVDGYATPSGRVNYTLNIDSETNPSNSVAVNDWFIFSLSSQTNLRIDATGGTSMVLMDSSGTSLLKSDIAGSFGASTQILTGLLGTGNYYLGLGASANSVDDYQISFTPQ